MKKVLKSIGGEFIEKDLFYTCIQNTYERTLLVDAKMFGINYLDNIVVIENKNLIEDMGLESFADVINDNISNGKINVNILSSVYSNGTWKESFIVVEDMEAFLANERIAFAILSHESGHIQNRTHDEFIADEYAIKLGYKNELLSFLENDALNFANIFTSIGYNAKEQLDSRIRRIKRA